MNRLSRLDIASVISIFFTAFFMTSILMFEFKPMHDPILVAMKEQTQSVQIEGKLEVIERN